MLHIKNRKPNCICFKCSKDIYRRPYQIVKGPVFCSKNCYGLYHRKEHPCVVCGLPVRSLRGAKTCSRACSNKNRKGIVYDKSNLINRACSNRLLKEKLINLRGPKCERCDYDNTNVLQSHHKIRKADGGSDDPLNLELLCPNCHYTEHLGDSRIPPYPPFVCRMPLD